MVRFNNFRCCKGCTTETGRHPGCHSTCPEYQEQFKLNEKIKEKRRLAGEYHGYIKGNRFAALKEKYPNGKGRRD